MDVNFRQFQSGVNQWLDHVRSLLGKWFGGAYAKPQLPDRKLTDGSSAQGPKKRLSKRINARKHMELYGNNTKVTPSSQE